MKQATFTVNSNEQVKLGIALLVELENTALGAVESTVEFYRHDDLEQAELALSMFDELSQLLMRYQEEIEPHLRAVVHE